MNTIHEQQTRADDKKLLMMGLIERISTKFVVTAVPGINRCFIRKGDKEDPFKFAIQTEGINFRKIWEYPDVFDINRIACNSVYDTLVNYGTALDILFRFSLSFTR